MTKTSDQETIGWSVVRCDTPGCTCGSIFLLINDPESRPVCLVKLDPDTARTMAAGLQGKAYEVDMLAARHHGRLA